MKKSTFLTALCATAVGVLFTTAGAYAQTSTPGGPSTGGPTPAAATVPLDGGASLLLISGAALGLKKLRDRYRTR